MKNNIQIPKQYPIYIERRMYLMIVLLTTIAVSGFITYYSFKHYTVYHIYSAFAFAISTVYLSWLYFNPFCIVYDTHFEINTGLFSHKKFFYRDIHQVELSENHKLIIIYNGHESEEISIRIVKKAERKNLVELIKWHIYKDLHERDE